MALVSVFAGAKKCHAQFHVEYYYSGATWTGTTHNTVGSVAWVYPPGLPAGTYYFYQSPGSDYSSYTSTGSTDPGTTVVTGPYNAYYAGTGVTSYPVKIHSTSTAWQTSNPGMDFANHPNGPITYTRSNVQGTGDNGTTTLANTVYTMPGGTAAASKALLSTVVTYDGNKAHTVVLKQNGVQKTAYTSPATGVPGAVNVGGTYDALPGDDFEWYVDGVLIATQTASATFTFPTEPDGNTYPAGQNNFSLTDDPPGTSSPVVTPDVATGTQSHLGNTTTTTSTGTGSNVNTTKTTKVNNSGTTISGTGQGATNQDIYNAVKAALNDAGNSGQRPATNLAATDDNSVELADKGSWDDAFGKHEDAWTKAQSAKDDVKGKLQSAKGTLDSIVQNYGNETYIDFGTVELLGSTVELRFSLTSGWGATFTSVMRKILLWGATIGFVMVCAQSTKGYL